MPSAVQRPVDTSQAPVLFPELDPEKTHMGRTPDSIRFTSASIVLS